MQETIKLDDMDHKDGKRAPADETVEFSFRDSGPLVIDLSAANVKKFTALIQPWIDAARPGRKNRGGGGSKEGPTAGMTPEDLRDFREWAAAQGQPVERYQNAETGKKGGYKYVKEQVDAYKAARGAGTGS